MASGSASRPWLGGSAHHLPSGVGELPSICLLPGDPARVDKAAAVLDNFRIIGQNREFRMGVGSFGGTEIALCSTGIGGPSTEIAVVELHLLGVRAVIRTGGMGALRSGIAPGDICVVSQALREGRAAQPYLPPTERAWSSPRLTHALLQRAEQLGHTPHDITVLSTDSYYLGQARPLPGFEAVAQARLDEIRSLEVDAMDMECETVLAVGGALGMHAAAALVTHGSRVTDTWLDDYESAQVEVLRVAAAAASTWEVRE